MLFCKIYILYPFSYILFAFSTYKILLDIVDDFDNLVSYNLVEEYIILWLFDSQYLGMHFHLRLLACPLHFLA